MGFEFVLIREIRVRTRFAYFVWFAVTFRGRQRSLPSGGKGMNGRGMGFRFYSLAVHSSAYAAEPAAVLVLVY